MDETTHVDDANDASQRPQDALSNRWISLVAMVIFATWWIGLRFHTWEDQSIVLSVSMTALAVMWCWFAATGLSWSVPLIFASNTYWTSADGMAARKTFVGGKSILAARAACIITAAAFAFCGIGLPVLLNALQRE